MSTMSFHASPLTAVQFWLIVEVMESAEFFHHRNPHHCRGRHLAKWSSSGTVKKLTKRRHREAEWAR